ncbi:MAG: hypothetical protein BGO77_03585 [Caedibacter sp. 37-49]|nr:MAG: hypothetical protein BGO77_03585 [Caedibacter sp. 37-49]
MKKLALTVASAAVLASAANAAMEGKHFTGFYVGGQLGYGSGKSEWNSRSAVAGENFARKTDLGTRGIVGGLHVGFGKEFNNKMYLGLEAFGNLSKTEGKERSLIGNTRFYAKAKRKNEFGAALRPGFVCGNALLYVKAGVSSAKWEYRSAWSQNAVVTERQNTSKHRIAFVPGIGVSMLVSEHVIVGVEATHTIYKKQSAPMRTANGRQITERGNIKTHVTDFTGRVSYKW